MSVSTIKLKLLLTFTKRVGTRRKDEGADLFVMIISRILTLDLGEVGQQDDTKTIR